MPRASATVEPAAENLDTPQTDWEEVAQEQLPNPIQVLLNSPEMQTLLKQLKAEAKEEAKVEMRGEVAAALNPSQPVKSLRSNVHDRFITEANGAGQALAHFRCDTAMAVKMIEYDMVKLRAYLSGEKEAPEGKNIKHLCQIKGRTLNWIDGHCYVYTENQRENIYYYRDELSVLEGGMPGIYEDTGGRLWRCMLCGGLEPFGSEETFNQHMLRTHGTTRAA